MIERPAPVPYKKQPWQWSQLKADGNRLTVLIGDKTEAWGRRLDAHLEYMHRYPRLAKMFDLPPGIYDGEIFVPGHKASMVATALRDPSIPLEFHAFAIPQFQGQDAREWHLDRVFDTSKAIGLPFLEYGQDICLESAKAKGGEGWVLKNAHWGEWYKIKPEETVDMIVTGEKDGKGKYLGLLGALECSLYRDGKLVKVSSVSGMTDAQRIEMSDESPIGRVCEIKYQYINTKGGLRHPRFIRWRDDKPAEECTYAQLDV